MNEIGKGEKMIKLDLIATSAMGLEALVAKEVRNLGYECSVENGRISFKGDERAIARSNLWLRTADRVKIRVGEFRAISFDELFEKTKALTWEQFLPEDAEFPVSGKSIKSKLFSVSDCQAIVKKAIVERSEKITINEIPGLKKTGLFLKLKSLSLKILPPLRLTRAVLVYISADTVQTRERHH